MRRRYQHFLDSFDRWLKLDPDAFKKQVRQACRSYLNNNTLSNLIIAEIAAYLDRSNVKDLSDKEIIDLAGRYAHYTSRVYDRYYYHYYEELKSREREQAIRAITLRNSIETSISSMQKMCLSGTDKLVVQCLQSYLDPKPSPLTAHLSRREYYHSLSQGIELLSYHLATYFADHLSLFYPIADALRPTEEGSRPIKLSRQERAVLQLAAEGVSDSKTLAQRLNVSISTIETYWKRIRHKLGTRTRTEALIKAYQAKLIS